jgi:hypothetical protein
MTKKQQKLKRPPLWIVISMILTMFIGIITAVIGIKNIENYFHPYWFSIIFGGLGLVVGIFMAKRFKPYIAVNPKIKSKYGMTILNISTGFLGVFLLLGSVINHKLSKIDKCENYIVINKYRTESGYHQPEINSLIVNIDGESQRLICNRDYWFKTSIGQSIDLCIYKSKLGFDFISMKYDK